MTRIKVIREGISYPALRNSKANNKYMKCYDEYKQSNFITKLDGNNLYGWAMGQYRNYSGFKQLNQKEIDRFDVNSISENSPIGHILEADLEHSNELHELCNDYPLAPEKLKVSHDMLSNYCINIVDKYGIEIGGANKSVPNLGNKSKSCFHYKDYQLYLSLGMKLTKVHRALEFKQSDMLNKFINFNTDKRKQCC